MQNQFVLPCCITALIVGASLFMQTATNNGLARCENRGGSVTECRLVVLGR
jgi:hypothetical protein